MFSVLTSAWALLIGMSLIMLGNGLQGTLLGIRATMEGFPTTLTGLVMSGYFVGFLLGSILVPKLVKSVGHVRVFAALGSLASTVVLLHIVFIDPWGWMLLRVVTGFCYAGLYVVAESWINDRATNETRGQLLAFYMVIVLCGMGGGQYLLVLGDPGEFVLFVLSSVLISAALIPILLNKAPAPVFETPETVSLIGLYRLAPLGVVAASGIGMAHATLVGMGPIYAENIGLSIEGIAFFMSMIFAGGVLFQWPLGRLSDHFDRRRVLTLAALGTGIAAVALAFSGPDSPVIFFALILLVGGGSLPLYSICIAHTNDNLTKDQMVAASGTIYIFVGLGASVGPTIVAFLMDQSGPGAYLYFLAFIHFAVAAFALYRMSQRSVPLEDQGPSFNLVTAATSLATALTVETVRDQMDSDLARMSSTRMRRM